MTRGIDSHRRLVCVFTGDSLVHLKQVAVTLLNDIKPQTPDRVAEIEVNAAPTWADSSAFVANFLCCSRCDVSRGEISISRILALEEVISFINLDLLGRASVTRLLWNPPPPVVSQRFGHQRQL